MESATVLDGTPQPRPSLGNRPAPLGEGPLERYLGHLLRQGMDTSAKDACVALMLESIGSADSPSSEHAFDSGCDGTLDASTHTEDSTFQAFLRG